MGKKANSGFFWLYCCLWHQSLFMQSAKWTFINIKAQGHLLTFVLDASDSVFLTSVKWHLWNHWADRNPIICGASMGRGNKNVFVRSRSHDQDGRHTHIQLNSSKIFFPGNKWAMTMKLGMQHPIKSVQMMTLDWVDFSDSDSVEVYDIKVDLCNQLNELPLWISKVKVMSWPFSWMLQIQYF